MLVNSHVLCLPLTATRLHIIAQGERSVTLGRKIKIVLTLKGSHKTALESLLVIEPFQGSEVRVSDTQGCPKAGNPGLLYVTLSASCRATNRELSISRLSGILSRVK